MQIENKMKERTEKVATWLELAAAPYSRGARLVLRVHPLLHRAKAQSQKCQDQICYAISVDERWLHSGDGRLTVLKGIATVNRFMRLIKMSYESGHPAHADISCGQTAYCMTGDRKTALRACP